MKTKKYSGWLFRTMKLTDKHIHIDGVFSKVKIAYSQVASVGHDWLKGIVIETTGGNSYDIWFWGRNKEKEAINIILSKMET